VFVLVTGWPYEREVTCNKARLKPFHLLPFLHHQWGMKWKWPNILFCGTYKWCKQIPYNKFAKEIVYTIFIRKSTGDLEIDQHRFEPFCFHAGSPPKWLMACAKMHGVEGTMNTMTGVREKQSASVLLVSFLLCEGRRYFLNKLLILNKFIWKRQET
jgi:hypothetical protein